MGVRGIFAAIVILGLAQSVLAANTPCSGKKGGVAGCQGETFICNDGSVSASKRSCSATTGAVGLMGGAGHEMEPGAPGDVLAAPALIALGQGEGVTASLTAAGRAI
jgi:hypothetical protein